MRILTRPNLGGPTRQAIALWHAQRALGLTTLLVTGTVDAIEDELSPADGGVPRLAFDAVLAGHADAGGWLALDDLRRGVAPRRDRRARRALVALMRAWRPDVVHTHTSKAGWLGRRAAGAADVVVVAHTFHGHVLQDYFGGLLSRWLRRQERRLARRTDLLFAVSGSCADELAAFGVAARDRFEVVPPAVPRVEVLPRAAARSQLGIAADERRIVAVGRLVPIKRLGDFVAMIGRDRELHGDIIGDGPQRARLEALAAAAAPGRIRLRGALPTVAAALPAYDAVVLPSVREGCPLIAVEAFAAGVPVIGYDVAGVRDVLGAWGGGLCVAEADGPAGLLAALRRLERQPELRQQCVAAATAGLARFDPAAIAQLLAAHYRGRPASPVRPSS